MAWEKVRNTCARLTKKKELDIKNEESRILKAGLSCIVRKHRFVTVQEFYTAFKTAQNAFYKYQEDCTKWEETYGEKATQKSETMHEKLHRYKEKAGKQNSEQTYRNRDKGAR